MLRICFILRIFFEEETRTGRPKCPRKPEFLSLTALKRQKEKNVTNAIEIPASPWSRNSFREGCEILPTRERRGTRTVLPTCRDVLLGS